jgi:hypothetical protein
VAFLCGIRPRLQRRVRDGISPSSLLWPFGPPERKNKITFWNFHHNKKNLNSTILVSTENARGYKVNIGDLFFCNIVTNQLAPSIPRRGTFMVWFPLWENQQGRGVKVNSYEISTSIVRMLALNFLSQLFINSHSRLLVNEFFKISARLEFHYRRSLDLDFLSGLRISAASSATL